METTGKPSAKNFLKKAGKVTLVAGLVAGALFGTKEYLDMKSVEKQREVQIKGNEAEKYLESVGRVIMDGVIYDLEENTVTFKDQSNQNLNSANGIGECEGSVISVEGQTQVGPLTCVYEENTAIKGSKPVTGGTVPAPQTNGNTTKGGL